MRGDVVTIWVNTHSYISSIFDCPLYAGQFSFDPNKFIQNLNCGFGAFLCSNDEDKVCCKGETVKNLCIATRVRCYKASSCTQGACNSSSKGCSASVTCPDFNDPVCCKRNGKEVTVRNSCVATGQKCYLKS